MVSSAQGATLDLGGLGTDFPCGGAGYTEIQTATGAAPRYDAPADGTITSWSISATSETDVFVKLKMFRPTNVAGLLDLIGESSTKGPLTPNMLNGPFQTSIPVRAGDVLGLDVVAGSGLGCGFTSSNMGDIMEEVNPDDSVVGDSVTTTNLFSPVRLNVAATLSVPEPATSPPPPAPSPTCVVPKLKGKKLKRAKKKLRNGDCRIGKVKGDKSGKVKKQNPKPGAVLTAGSSVNVKLG
ncbi:MAG TPA: PASTA domain-containing protein [Solirubrobacterales bacterium]|jgi:hypothetical protein|nr:PASTA domain-containing protein [Solirubrobacterales bacterium]